MADQDKVPIVVIRGAIDTYCDPDVIYDWIDEDPGPGCGHGQLVRYGCRTPKQLGRYTRYVYRQCNHCGGKTVRAEPAIGISCDFPTIGRKS